RITSAARLSIIATHLLGQAFLLKIPMRPGLAAAGPLSKLLALLENESFAQRAPIDGSGLLSLPRSIRSPTGKDQPFRLVNRDPSPHWFDLCNLAREFLYFRSTGTA